MIGVEDFTSNEVIDAIEMNDPTGDIIGYVAKVNNNFHSPRAAKFQKFVINNARGREVQIIAWNQNTKILKPITEMGLIVHIGLVKASPIRNKIYNSGNVNFELIIKENSTVEIYGKYKEENADSAIEQVTISEAYEKINQKIKIEALLKTELRKYKNRDFEFTVGSITDTYYKLEIKANCDCSSLNAKKGSSIEITGIVERFPPGPPVLRIDNVIQIKLIDTPRISFKEIYKEFLNNLIS